MATRTLDATLDTRAPRLAAAAAAEPDTARAVFRDAFFGRRPSTSSQGLEVIGCVHTLVAKG